MVDTPVKSKVRLSKSIVGSEELAALAEIIEDGYLGMGAEVQRFEADIADYLGGEREVVCVSTGTTALHLALQACGIGPGDEVLVPTLTYLASFQAISATGATPVACDVRYETGWLDIEDAVRRITPRTKAIMPVHYASGTGEIERLNALAASRGLRVIEDAAHAFGCLRDGRLVGSTGDVVCFSFDGIKNLTSGEGGAVVTADPVVAERVRNARLLGVVKDTEQRYAGKRSWEFDVVEQGWRYHLGNLYAAIGRVQLRRFRSEFQSSRKLLAARYQQLLSGMPGVRMLDIDYAVTTPHIFPILVQDGRRDEVRELLAAEGVESGIHYKPNHLLTLYGGGDIRLPVAERMYEELLTLPLHPEVTEDDQDRAVDVIRTALQPARSLAGKA